MRARGTVLGVLIAALCGGAVMSGSTASADEPERVGFLVVSPAEGDLDSVIDLVTSGECTRGTTYFVSLDGPGLDDPERGHLVGATSLGIFLPAEYPGHYLQPLPDSLARYVGDVAPGVRPVGEYTLSLVCRDTLSTEPLQAFTATISVDRKGSYRAKGKAARSIEEVTGLSGPVAYAGGTDPLPPDTAGLVASTETEAPSSNPLTRANPFLLGAGLVLVVGAAAFWRRTSRRGDTEP